MSKRKRPKPPREHTAPPTQLRGMLRELARWAIASSVSAAGCSADHTALDVSQDEPSESTGASAGAAASAGDANMQRPAPSGGAGGAGGTSGAGGASGAGAAGGMSGAGGAIGTSGAGGAGPVTPPVLADWMMIDCSGGLNVLMNVALKEPFEYVALYGSKAAQAELAPEAPATPAFTWLMNESGWACKTASDSTACFAKLKAIALPSQACIDAGECDSFLVVANGDDITRREGRAALLALLGGTIDSEYEALLIAMFDGHVMACPTTTIPVLRGTRTKPNGDGYDIDTERWADCGPAIGETLHVTAAGEVTMTEPTRMIAAANCSIGRRPEGLCPPAHALRASALGAFFAGAARLEAASVPAFERLAAELLGLGAPHELVTQAVRAALDEIAHARMIGALARRFGTEPDAVQIAPWRARTAFDIALENAVEGCVRETYGALLAHHQAQSAADTEARAVMQRIAEDETRHAELAWGVARWLEPRLAAHEQRALAAARAAAFAQLFREVDAGLSQADAHAIGWPAPPIAARMLGRLGMALGIG